MGKHIPKIVLSLDVWKKIKWFTEHMDTEIGAVGTMDIKEEDGEKYFYVDKLFFPKQRVTSATIHFTGEMWGELVRDVGMEDLGRIAFYWHRHPGGSPHHSGTDDEDTFETFMSKDANPPRQYFAFLQTAWKDNDVVFESRIDIRRPIRATILDQNIEVQYEIEPKDQELEDECLAIKENCIVKYTPPAVPQQYNRTNGWASRHDIQRFGTGYSKPEKITNDIEALKTLFGNYEVEKDRVYMDNDSLNGISTSEEEKCSFEIVNGQLTIKASQDFQKVMIAALDPKGKLYHNVRQVRQTDIGNGRVQYNIQPKGGTFQKLCVNARDIFYNYNKVLFDKINKDVSEPIKIIDVEPEQRERKESHVIENDPDCVEAILEEMQHYTRTDWGKDGCTGIVYELDDSAGFNYMGSLEISPGYDKLECSGLELCDLIVSLQEDFLDDIAYEVAEKEGKKALDKAAEEIIKAEAVADKSEPKKSNKKKDKKKKSKKK